ncbi:MAG: hypothetical protein QW728_02530 [Thermoplasmata archaeon]
MIGEPFRTILETVFAAEAFSSTWKEELRAWEETAPGNRHLIMRQWAHLVLDPERHLEEYIHLTGDSLGHPARMSEHMKRLWREYYEFEFSSMKEVEDYIASEKATESKEYGRKGNQS